MKGFLVFVVCVSMVLSAAICAWSATGSLSDDAAVQAALEKFTWVSPEAEIIMGTPIEVNGLKLIPLATVGIGFGPYESQANGEKMAGAGGLMTPVGVIVVSGQEVRIVRLSKGFVEQLVGTLAPIALQIMKRGPIEVKEQDEIQGRIERQKETERDGSFLSIYWKIILSFFLIWLILAFLIEKFFPQKVATIATIFRYNYIQICLFGLIGYGIMFLLAALFTVSIIGIPFTFAVIILTGIITLLGTIGFALFIGEQSATAFKYHYSEMRLMLIGGILFGILGLIPVFGLIIWAIIGVFGFGAVLQMQWGNGRKQHF